MALSPDLRDRVFAWVADDPERQTAQEALALVVREDEAALLDRFGARLEFGTAGLRGLLGAGPNRMNRAVVCRTTAGLCSYLFKHIPHSHARGIVIGRDGREGSDRFALDAARVAMGMGFVVHYFNEVVPTPVLAFAVRDLGAAAGVMVTASHNPAEYNGYKVYWQNAAQIIPPHDIGIAEAIDAIQSAKALTLLDPEAGRTLGLFRTVSRDVLNHYYGSLSGLRFERPADQSISIAYTPMHGVGAPFVKRAMDEGGFKNFAIVPEQEKPDPAFPTVRFPNPEEKGAMDLVLALAEAKKADLVLANDPDADRLAVAYRNRDGKYVMLSGNEIGVLIGHHRLVDDPKLQANRLVLASLVSSPQLGAIAKELGVRYGETLTGFKWIANTAIDLEASDQAKFVFGFEEALGYTVGTIVRDKDGVSAALVCAQLAAMLKVKGQTIGDRLDEISARFGVYSSEQHSANYPGLSGAATIRNMMANLRAKTPWAIGGTKVESLRDYEKGETFTAGGASTKLNSPPSNVLAFDLEGDARIIARPSGTEPKIKFYFDVRTRLVEGESLAQARVRGAKRVAELKQAFLAIAEAGAR